MSKWLWCWAWWASPSQPPVTCPVRSCFCFGNKLYWKEMLKCRMAVQGFAWVFGGVGSPGGPWAQAWCQGSQGQGGGCIWWCQARNIADFSAAWLVSVVFCCLCLKEVFILSVPWDEWLVIYIHMAAVFWCDVFVCFLGFVLIRTIEDEVWV